VTAREPNRARSGLPAPVAACLALALALAVPLSPVCPALAGEGEMPGSSCCGCCEMPSDCACGDGEGGAGSTPPATTVAGPELPQAEGAPEEELHERLPGERAASRGLQAIPPPGSSPPLFLSDCSFLC
jgi:hypothetical protein